MNIIYYTETNLICIIILAMLKIRIYQKSDQHSTVNKVYDYLICATVLMCAADMIAGICRGQRFFGARAIIELSNLIYFEALAIISFLWMIYVFIKLNVFVKHGKEIALWSIPLLLFSLAAITNPLTDFLFYIDENNLYVRSHGAYFHWLISWMYLITATVLTVYRISRETNKQKRKELAPLLYFIVAPTVASVIQMLFYGVTSSQVGVTISIIFIFLSEQNKQLLTDALTGLNNRYGFNKYLEEHLQRRMSTDLHLIMIDINNFKHINDKFGHITGDNVLVSVAEEIKTVCEEAAAKFFVGRYGGDEFIIAGYNCGQDTIEKLKSDIHKKVGELSRLRNDSCTISVSIGVVCGKCSASSDVEHLLRMADEAMYYDKKLAKASMASDR